MRGNNHEHTGLYDPSYEHDSCGIGFVANINGTKSRSIVSDAITMLENMEHRGGQGAEPTSGDGAGILVQVPHAFLKDAVAPLGFDLPVPGAYGVGAMSKRCSFLEFNASGVFWAVGLE